MNSQKIEDLVQQIRDLKSSACKIHNKQSIISSLIKEYVEAVNEENNSNSNKNKNDNNSILSVGSKISLLAKEIESIDKEIEDVSSQVRTSIYNHGPSSEIISKVGEYMKLINKRDMIGQQNKVNEAVEISHNNSNKKEIYKENIKITNRLN